MISDRSCDIEIGVMTITVINYILKYIKKAKLLLQIVTIFHNITVFSCSNKCSFGAFKNKNFTDPKLLNSSDKA